VTAADELIARLRLPLQPENRRARILQAFRSESAVHGALTLGDLVYDVARLQVRDELAVRAFDFARSADLQDIYRLAQFATEIQAKPAAAMAGDVSQLQGYVFERMAGLFFERQGAEVYFPETSNHPGADLCINGEWFQAKCSTSPAVVLRHFERYPEVPVVVNEDLAPHFADHPLVMGIPGITSETVRASTHQALSDAADILDFEICIYMPVSTASRAAFAWFRGETDLVGAATELAMGSAGRAIGAGAGKAAAAGVILAAGVAGWPAIILPLAAAVGGAVGGRSATTQLKQLIFGRSYVSALRSSTSAYCRQAAVCVERILSISADQLSFWQHIQRRASREWAAIFQDWIERLQDHRARQKLALSRLRGGAADPEALEEGEGPIHGALRAAKVAGAAGVTSRELLGEARALSAAAEQYQRAMRRHFLNPR